MKNLKRSVECVGVSPVPGVFVELHNEPCECCGKRHSDYVAAGECLLCGQPGVVIGDDGTGKAVYCVACDVVSLVMWVVRRACAERSPERRPRPHADKCPVRFSKS